MLKETDKQAAQKELAKIFGEIMPAAGLPERAAQAELSKKMLAAMLDNNIALCEAGTGIGKPTPIWQRLLCLINTAGLPVCH